MSDKYEIYEYKGAFASDKRVLKNGKAVNEFGLLKDVQKLQAENAELKKQSQWISVKDELPEFNTSVLVKIYRKRGVTWPEADYLCTAKLSQVARHCGENSPIDNRWYVFPSGGNEITKEVTHWMPLPCDPL